MLSHRCVREGEALPTREQSASENQEGMKTNPARLDVQTVLQGAREAILVNGTQEYRLRLTSNGKLILTK